MRPFYNMHWYRYLLLISAAVLLLQCEDESMVHISDRYFLEALIDSDVDQNEDGKISFAEAEAVTYLNVSEADIVTLSGLEKYINLETLICRRNRLSSIDLSGNRMIKYLDCDENHINHLQLSACKALETLKCYQNRFVTLDISNKVALKYLDCNVINIRELDVSNNIALEYLNCTNDHYLTSLDISNNPSLKYLSCSSNSLTTLDVSLNVKLKSLNCRANDLEFLDVSNNHLLEVFICSANALSQLDISIHSELKFLWIEDMPSLHEVCVWTLPFPPENLQFKSQNSPNVSYTMKYTS